MQNNDSYIGFCVIIWVACLLLANCHRVVKFTYTMANLDSITDRTIQHHFESFIHGDLEEILSDYSEESVIITPEDEYRGIEEIRKFFSNAIVLYPKGSTIIVIDKFVSSGPVSYVVWHGETPGFKVDFSTATYLIRDHKIIIHTIGRVVARK